MRPSPRASAGIYCERSRNTLAGSLSSSTCRDLCRLTHPEWGNTLPDDCSTGYATGRARFGGVIWVELFAVNSRASRVRLKHPGSDAHQALGISVRLLRSRGFLACELVQDASANSWVSHGHPLAKPR